MTADFPGLLQALRWKVPELNLFDDLKTPS